ncbi:hypothetical protein GF324_11400 [bacterium]|nr:hypothetical protein [bacterium]
MGGNRILPLGVICAVIMLTVPAGYCAPETPQTPAEERPEETTTLPEQTQTQLIEGLAARWEKVLELSGVFEGRPDRDLMFKEARSRIAPFLDSLKQEHQNASLHIEILAMDAMLSWGGASYAAERLRHSAADFEKIPWEALNALLSFAVNLEQWDLVVELAKELQKADDTILADLQLMEMDLVWIRTTALIEMNRNEEVIRLLEPYREPFMRDPGPSSAMLGELASAYAAKADTAEAFDVLKALYDEMGGAFARPVSGFYPMAALTAETLGRFEFSDSLWAQSRTGLDSLGIIPGLDQSTLKRRLLPRLRAPRLSDIGYAYEKWYMPYTGLAPVLFLYDRTAKDSPSRSPQMWIVPEDTTLTHPFSRLPTEGIAHDPVNVHQVMVAGDAIYAHMEHVVEDTGSSEAYGARHGIYRYQLGWDLIGWTAEHRIGPLVYHRDRDLLLAPAADPASNDFVLVDFREGRQAPVRMPSRQSRYKYDVEVESGPWAFSRDASLLAVRHFPTRRMVIAKTTAPGDTLWIALPQDTAVAADDWLHAWASSTQEETALYLFDGDRTVYRFMPDEGPRGTFVEHLTLKRDCELWGPHPYGGLLFVVREGRDAGYVVWARPDGKTMDLWRIKPVARTRLTPLPQASVNQPQWVAYAEDERVIMRELRPDAPMLVLWWAPAGFHKIPETPWVVW